MWNLLNGELYKLRKAKSFYVCALVMVIVVFWLYGMLLIANKIEQGEIEQSQMNGAVVVEVETESENSMPDSLGILDVYQVIAGNLATLITAVFSSMYVISEFTTGAIKNVAGKGYQRGKIFLAKYLVVELAVLALFLTGAVATLIGGCIFFGTEEVNSGFLRDYAVYTMYQAVLIMVLNGIITAVGEIIRNIGVGITAAVCICGGFASLLFYGLDLLLHKTRICTSDYWITTLIAECPLSGFDAVFVRHFLIAIVLWTAVAAGIGLLHFHKADIE